MQFRVKTHIYSNGDTIYYPQELIVTRNCFTKKRKKYWETIYFGFNDRGASVEPLKAECHIFEEAKAIAIKRMTARKNLMRARVKINQNIKLKEVHIDYIK